MPASSQEGKPRITWVNNTMKKYSNYLKLPSICTSWRACSTSQWEHLTQYTRGEAWPRPLTLHCVRSCHLKLMLLFLKMLCIFQSTSHWYLTTMPTTDTIITCQQSWRWGHWVPWLVDFPLAVLPPQAPTGSAQSHSPDRAKPKLKVPHGLQRYSYVTADEARLTNSLWPYKDMSTMVRYCSNRITWKISLICCSMQNLLSLWPPFRWRCPPSSWSAGHICTACSTLRTGDQLQDLTVPPEKHHE